MFASLQDPTQIVHQETWATVEAIIDQSVYKNSAIIHHCYQRLIGQKRTSLACPFAQWRVTISETALVRFGLIFDNDIHYFTETEGMFPVIFKNDDCYIEANLTTDLYALYVNKVCIGKINVVALDTFCVGLVCEIMLMDSKEVTVTITDFLTNSVFSKHGEAIDVLDHFTILQNDPRSVQFIDWDNVFEKQSNDEEQNKQKYPSAILLPEGISYTVGFQKLVDLLDPYVDQHLTNIIWSYLVAADDWVNAQPFCSSEVCGAECHIYWQFARLKGRRLLFTGEHEWNDGQCLSPTTWYISPRKAIRCQLGFCIGDEQLTEHFLGLGTKEESALFINPNDIIAVEIEAGATMAYMYLNGYLKDCVRFTHEDDAVIQFICDVWIQESDTQLDIIHTLTPQLM